MPDSALSAFARKKATKDQLLRALCEYDKWFVPISVANLAMSNRTFECLSVWGAVSKVPAEHLYLFTDVEAGQRAAKGAQLGPYASPVPGAGLFGNLPDTFTEVHVNPGSPDERTWLIGGDWVELARRWGAAVSLEKKLAGKLKGELTEALIDFPAFTTLKKPDGGIATKPGANQLKNPAMVFTAPDCADAALAAGGPAMRKYQRVTATGRQLFGAFSSLSVDGFVFNPHGPGPTRALDEPHCWGILTAMAGRG